VFRALLALGCMSFGGPVAHLGYFREAFVVRRGWLDEAAYVDLVALAQFLPGPASSQVGFAIGLTRAGWLGGLAAFAGFTLPSAALLTAFAYLSAHVGGTAWDGLLHGLKLTAVAIVAQAVFGMARTLTPDAPRATLAAAALALVAIHPGSLSQIGAILVGAALGPWICRAEGARGSPRGASPVSPAAGALCFALFLAGLALAFVATSDRLLGLAEAFYRSGGLVFGGGHVVLPLLKSAVVDAGFVPDSAFLAGYGAAQAAPGPLFAFAAYLGAVAAGLAGACVALAAIFLPGLLAMAGALPFWGALSARAPARGAMAGVNAAVVGLLASAFYDPVFVGAVRAPLDFAEAAAGFVALVAWRAPPIAVVGALAALGAALG
jgi:chromate transporter